MLIQPTNTYALFTTNSSIINTLHTIKYNFKIDSSEGKYINTNTTINNNKILLPEPIKEGYTFTGYRIDNNIYNNEIDLSLINNKTIYATYNINNYNITYNLNGGTTNNLKETYNIEEEFTLPNPVKEGYIFEGWTGSNGSIPEKDLVIKKGTTNNLEFTANYSDNSSLVTIIPTIDNIEYKDGYLDYTFDVYINDKLVKENTSTWKDYIKVGSKVRIKANTLPGRTTTYDETRIIKDRNNYYLYPSWTVNNYDSEFYYNNNFITKTINKYGTIVKTPNLQASNLGYNDNFYYIKEYQPTESSIQLDKTLRFEIIIDERMCYTSFGNAPNNAIYQLEILRNNGYNNCNLTDWNSVQCSAKYTASIALYNNIWNILPKTGNGYSTYKQIYCDSNWSIYERR